jgi:hypothetical protein
VERLYVWKRLEDAAPRTVAHKGKGSGERYGRVRVIRIKSHLLFTSAVNSGFESPQENKRTSPLLAPGRSLNVR